MELTAELGNQEAIIIIVMDDLAFRESSPKYWEVSIKIPDKEFEEEIVEYFKHRIEESLASPHVSKDYKKFIDNCVFIATSREELRSYYDRARENGVPQCLVIALNSSLSAQERNDLRVNSFTYMSWSKKAWNALKKAYSKKVIKEMVHCLLRNLLDASCQFVIKKLFPF